MSLINDVWRSLVELYMTRAGHWILFLYLNTNYMLKMYLNTKYFLQMYLNTKYIDVFKYFFKYFCKYFFILFSKYRPYSFNPL